MLALYLIVSIAPGLYAGWRVAGETAWKSMENERRNYPYSQGDRIYPDGDNWFGGVMLGIVAFFFWPAFAVVWLCGRDKAGLWRLIYVPPKHREALLERRIRELERQAGINQRPFP